MAQLGAKNYVQIEITGHHEATFSGLCDILATVPVITIVRIECRGFVSQI